MYNLLKFSLLHVCGKCFTLRMSAPLLRQKSMKLTQIYNYNLLNIKKLGFYNKDWKVLYFPPKSQNALIYSALGLFFGINCAKIAPMYNLSFRSARKMKG